jgi:large subunit ribosomal protein L18
MVNKMSAKNASVMRKIRQIRVRKNLSGSELRPRLNIFRSSKHIYAQVINDVTGKTLCAVSTLTPEVKDNIKDMGKVAKAVEIGKKIAEKCKSLGIEKVVFDRGGFIYHGRVAALAKGAREAGLSF